ncbi:MAG: tetratricopeptide repeat protein [Bacillota bacterium]|nr:tetratricopeptide repeat protein [Bacillota bacterium]
MSGWRAGGTALRLLLVVTVLTLPVVAGGAVRPAEGAKSSPELWEVVLKEHGPRGDLESLFWVAVAHANLGRIEESRQAFQRLDTADPQRTAAVAIAEKSRARLVKEPHDLQALNGVAFLAYAEGNYAEAATGFREVVRLDPQNPWARSYLGFSLGKAGRIDEAVRVLEEGVRLFPDNEILHFLLGLAYYQKGAIVRALIEMAKAPRAVRYFR